MITISLNRCMHRKISINSSATCLISHEVRTLVFQDLDVDDTSQDKTDESQHPLNVNKAQFETAYIEGNS